MKPYSFDLRQKVINAHNNKEGSQRELAKRFSVSLSFVQSLLRRYRSSGTIEPKPHGGGQIPKLNNEQLVLVGLLVESNNDATLVELCDRERTTDSNKDKSFLNGQNHPKAESDTQKKTLHASEKYTERVQKLRAEYWTIIGEVNLADLVFIDEVGVNIAMTRRFARSPQGSRAYGNCPDGRGKNVTMIGAMSTEGIIAAMTFTGGTNASAFQTYVAQVLVPSLWPGATVVMDNFSSHKVTGIKEAIEAVGARLVYLSPYSPDFSPIENCWSKVKEFLRSQAARTYQELDEAITNALNTVTKKDIIGWFTHCCYYIAPN